MGATKQKWTAEEESALRNGIAKLGPGKWRSILRDPEFGGILSLRSNVDLKDKWRNLSITANGWGSQEKARIALKKSRHVPDHDDKPMAMTNEVEYNNEVDVKPLALSSEAMKISTPKRSESRLDSLILEALTKLKEPAGSSKADIAMYIEDQYEAPANFKQLLSDKLKVMTRSGKLIKVKHKYMIAPSSPFSKVRGSSKVLLSEERHREPSRADRGDLKSLTKYQTDAELARIRTMTTQEAAAAAAQAVAEAEIAKAEAEEATKEAEAAETEFEEAQAFAEAAKLALDKRNAAKQWAMKSYS